MWVVKYMLVTSIVSCMSFIHKHNKCLIASAPRLHITYQRIILEYGLSFCTLQYSKKYSTKERYTLKSRASIFALPHNDKSLYNETTWDPNLESQWSANLASIRHFHIVIFLLFICLITLVWRYSAYKNNLLVRNEYISTKNAKKKKINTQSRH